MDAEQATAAGLAVKRTDRRCGLTPDGLWRASSWAEHGLVLRARPRRIGYVFFLFNFPKLLFNAKTISERLKMFLRHENSITLKPLKYSDHSENSKKIPRERLGHEESK
jgi:hypothetical protein